MRFKMGGNLELLALVNLCIMFGGTSVPGD